MNPKKENKKSEKKSQKIKTYKKLLGPPHPQNTDTHTKNVFVLVETRKMRPISRYKKGRRLLSWI